jgi:hypothetical protein
MLTYADDAAPKDERVYKQQHLHGAAVGKAPANSGFVHFTLLTRALACFTANSGSHFTCFTGTKVQLRFSLYPGSHLHALRRLLWFSLYLLYWYKGTSTDAAGVSSAATFAYKTAS